MLCPEHRQGLQQVVEVVNAVVFQLNPALFAAGDDPHPPAQLGAQLLLRLRGIVDSLRRGGFFRLFLRVFYWIGRYSGFFSLNRT